MSSVVHVSGSKRQVPSGYGDFVSYWLSSAPPSAAPVRPRGARAAVRRNRLKRALDVAAALVLLLLLGPAMLAMVGLVAMAGGRPIYGHERVGHGGRRFCCWKIRTMVRDADRRLDDLLHDDPDLSDEWARDHKLRRDPRVTRLGWWLRLTSFDELPQLWNVLAGDMSLVGPRPVTAAELDRYGASVRHYLRVRPGLTGLWQLSGRNDLPYRRRVALDRLYVVRWSLRRDVGLILGTPAALLCRNGC